MKINRKMMPIRNGKVSRMGGKILQKLIDWGRLLENLEETALKSAWNALLQYYISQSTKNCYE